MVMAHSGLPFLHLLYGLTAQALPADILLHRSRFRTRGAPPMLLSSRLTAPSVLAVRLARVLLEKTLVCTMFVECRRCISPWALTRSRLMTLPPARLLLRSFLVC